MLQTIRQNYIAGGLIAVIPVFVFRNIICFLHWVQWEYYPEAIVFQIRVILQLHARINKTLEFCVFIRQSAVPYIIFLNFSNHLLGQITLWSFEEIIVSCYPGSCNVHKKKNRHSKAFWISTKITNPLAVILQSDKNNGKENHQERQQKNSE